MARPAVKAIAALPALFYRRGRAATGYASLPYRPGGRHRLLRRRLPHHSRGCSPLTLALQAH